MQVLDASRLSAHEFLAAARTSGSRRRDLGKDILEKGVEVLRRLGGLSLASGLKEGEEWSIREQVVLAAMDSDKVSAAATAEKELKAIEREFPDSARAMRLRAMWEEHCGNWPKADAIYAKLIEKNPSNTWAMKRRAAVLKARGRIDDAIAALVDFLGEFHADVGAWMELSQLYIRQGNIASALFCCEEVLIAQPEHYVANLLCAELLFTLGGADNQQNARKYFSQSLLMKRKGNIRAAWGLATTSFSLADTKGGLKSADGGTEKNKKLFKLAAAELDEAYDAPGVPKGMKELVHNVINSQRDVIQG